ncbi:MAG: SGNH/GDSL hydrolase family protein [Paludibacteraceae bacterium]|nr:SGNH/GDSL hydrolase family protein [Paludibacteraceae bacterium]
MKNFSFAVLFLALLFSAGVKADALTGFRFVDATEFQIINKGWDNTTEPYTRLPQQYMDSCREDQQWLYNHSSGIAVRFATNSKRIAAQYNLKNNFHMQHMAMTGIKGTDLYYLNEERGVWEYVNTARPQEKNFKADSIQSKVYVEHLDGEMHEYMLYLPLYDGVNWVQIGVDSTAQLIQPQVENPRKMGKIVLYGTSIQQGGCASRVGMVPSAMIQREYNLECVNLATSGQARMDFYIAEALASIEDAICYVIDPVPNCTKDRCDTATYDFIKILRSLRPEVPIIMVEGLMYPYTRHSSYHAEYLPQKNEGFRRGYELHKAENPKGLYYMTHDGQTGPEMEGTVDGVHLTDYGFRAYADILEIFIKKALDKTGVKYNLTPTCAIVQEKAIKKQLRNK